MARQADDLLAVAHVLRTHGVRGEVSVILLAPPVLDPRELLAGKRLRLRAAGGQAAERTMAVESIRPHQDRWLIKMEEVRTMDDAELLRGYDLCLKRSELPPLPEGWFWEADLIGIRVIDAQLGELGSVAELELSAQQPQLVIERSAGGRARIPWVKAYVREVNLDAGEIKTALPEEFPGISD